jgi:hypothetical protein
MFRKNIKYILKLNKVMKKIEIGDNLAFAIVMIVVGLVSIIALIFK